VGLAIHSVNWAWTFSTCSSLSCKPLLMPPYPAFCTIHRQFAKHRNHTTNYRCKAWRRSMMRPPEVSFSVHTRATSTSRILKARQMPNNWHRIRNGSQNPPVTTATHLGCGWRKASASIRQADWNVSSVDCSCWSMLRCSSFTNHGFIHWLFTRGQKPLISQAEFCGCDGGLWRLAGWSLVCRKNGESVALGFQLVLACLVQHAQQLSN
jgi:hypothetical protein